MELKRYRITGPGSLTRWEHNGIPTPYGQAPHPDASLVRHSRDENAELLLAARSVEANAHMRLVPILARDQIQVRAEAATQAAVEAAVAQTAPAAAAPVTPPPAPAAKPPKRAPRPAADGAAVTSKLG